MAKLALNLSEVKAEGSGFDYIPAGTYAVKITDSEVTETKAKTGHILTLSLQVIDGQYAGSTIADRINVNNPNPDAVKIGLARLKRYLESVGLNPNFIEDSNVLHGKKVIVRVDERPFTITDERTGEQKQINGCDVKKVFPYDEGAVSASPAQPASSQPSPSAAPADKPKLPWM